ncbi:hypothetical protein ACLEPN_30540 [Myxococcus sp. 1LA]
MNAAAALMLAARTCASVIRRDLYDGTPGLCAAYGGRELRHIQQWMQRIAGALDALAVGVPPRLFPRVRVHSGPLRSLQSDAHSEVPRAS